MIKSFIKDNPEYNKGFLCPGCRKGKCVYDYSEAYIAAYIDISIAGTEFEIYTCELCGEIVNNPINHTAEYGIKRGWSVL